VFASRTQKIDSPTARTQKCRVPPAALALLPTTAAYLYLAALRRRGTNNNLPPGPRGLLFSIRLGSKLGVVITGPGATPATAAAFRGLEPLRLPDSGTHTEVKGLRDLGFTFSDAEVDAELASIVPGLRRKRSEEENRATASAPAAPRDAPSPPEEAAAPAAQATRRPYLSEAWDDDEEEAEVRRALRNWRIPPPGDGNDLKEHLRMWAHTVASAVR